VKRNAARSEKAAGSRPHGRAMRSAVLGGGVTLPLAQLSDAVSCERHRNYAVHGSCSAAARSADEKMYVPRRSCGLQPGKAANSECPVLTACKFESLTASPGRRDGFHCWVSLLLLAAAGCYYCC
jgi:hypothetical protein